MLTYITFYITVPGERHMAFPFSGSLSDEGEVGIISTLSTTPMMKFEAIQECISWAAACENAFYGDYFIQDLDRWSANHFQDLLTNYLLTK